MVRYLYFLLSHTLFLPLWIGLYFKGYFTFLNIGYVFGILVILDILFGKENYVASKINMDKNETSMYKYVLYSWSFIHIFNVFLTLYLINTGIYSMFEIIGLIISLGIEGGQSIAVAHELCHKNNKFDRWLARFLLFFVLYNHFEIEHKHGHHVNVATELDPATAKFNQTFYSFWVQSVFGGIKSAYKLETLNKGFTIHNKMITITILYIIWLSYLFINNPIVMISFLLQSIFGFSFLELSNYFEHYGLVRKKISDDRYESVEFYHSWDNDNCISNWILFRLGRHADHHKLPYKEYQYLVPIMNSPQLITGYPGCALLCLVPPLWFKIMNPRVEQIRKKFS